MKADTIEQAIVTHSRSLRRFAVSLAGPDDSDDLFQTTCETAFRKRRSLRRASRARSWLMTIMYRQFVTERRRAARRGEVSTDQLTERGLGAFSAVKLDAVRVVDALSALPEDQRAAMVLVCVEGFTSEEAAHTLSVKPGSVRARVARGRARLKDLIGDRPLDGVSVDQTSDMKVRPHGN
jgi:RNA polymerase sigma-70 factor (ECF subfamily)